MVCKGRRPGTPYGNEQYRLPYRAGIWYRKKNAKALGWYLKAAKNGHKTAFSNIGRYYRDGVLAGTPQNYAEAYYWYSLAHKFGYSYAGYYRNSIEWALKEKDIESVRRRVANFSISKIDQVMNDLKGVYEVPSSASFNRKVTAPAPRKADRSANSGTLPPKPDGMPSTK